MLVCVQTLDFSLLFNPRRGNLLVTIAGRQTVPGVAQVLDIG